MFIDLEFGIFGCLLVVRFGGDHFGLLGGLELVDGGDELGEVEVGIELAEVLHDVLHFDGVLQLFFGQLLRTVSLSKVLALAVRHCPFGPHCLLDELVELLVGYHANILYIEFEWG